MKPMAKGRREFYKNKRRTLRQVFTWGMQPLEKPSSLKDRHYADTIKDLRYKKRRFTVGYARAFAGPHLFAGCYPGAENE